GGSCDQAVSAGGPRLPTRIHTALRDFHASVPERRSRREQLAPNVENHLNLLRTPRTPGTASTSRTRRRLKRSRNVVLEVLAVPAVPEVQRGFKRCRRFLRPGRERGRPGLQTRIHTALRDLHASVPERRSRRRTRDAER